MKRILFLGLIVTGIFLLPFMAPDRPPLPPTPFTLPSIAARTPADYLLTGQRIDLNTATIDDLIALPGIGPKLAQRIFAYRVAHGPFHHMRDLDPISGISPKTISALEPYLIIKSIAD